MANGFCLRSPAARDRSGGRRQVRWQRKALLQAAIAKADKRFTAHCERLEQEEKLRKQREKQRKQRK
jgi:hypothetical protein